MPFHVPHYKNGCSKTRKDIKTDKTASAGRDIECSRTLELGKGMTGRREGCHRNL